MLYAIVLDDFPTFYVHTETDEYALKEARIFSDLTGKRIRTVFVSAHNDAENAVSIMRTVFSRED